MPTFIQEILRWLPVTQRIQFKSLTLMRSFLNRSAQSHLQTLCTSVSSLPAWSLHSPLSCQRPYALCYCSVIHSGYFHSVSSSPQAYYSDALSTTLTTTRILTVSKLIRRTSTTAVKDLPKVHAWRLELDSNLSDTRRRYYQWAITLHAIQRLRLCGPL